MDDNTTGPMAGPGRKRPVRGVRLVRLKRGGAYHFRGTIFGIRLRGSTLTTDRRLAEVEISRIVAQAEKLYQGRGKPRKATYGEANQKRLGQGRHSAGSIRQAGAWLARIGADTLCEDVDWEMVERLAKEALRPGYAESTLKRAVVTVRATLGFAHGHFGLKRGCPAPCFPTLREGKPREVYLEPRHCKAMHALLVSQGHQLAADALCVGLGEGPRRSELHAMSFRFVDLERGVITLRDTKSSGEDEVRDRTIPDPRPWTIATLAAILDRRKDSADAVFVRADGTPHANENSFGAYVNKHLRSAAKAVGVPDWESVTLHVLRHTAATNTYLLTGDILEVEIRFDWNDGESVRRYIKRAPKQLAPEVAEMYGLTGIWHNPHALVRFANDNQLEIQGKQANL